MSKMSATQRRRRSYGKSGVYGLRRAVPRVLDRACDGSIAPGDLTDLERDVRALRRELLEDSGGAEKVSAARRILVDAVTGSAVLLATVDLFITKELGGALVDRREQKIRRIALDREKIAGGLSRMLILLGLEKRVAQPTLIEYLEKRQEAAQVADGDGAQQGAEEADR